MDSWSNKYVAEAAESAGLNGTKFAEHDVDGKALLELAHAYRATGAQPVALVDEASSAHGPKLRFLRLLRRWAEIAEAPRPSAPPPPEPPLPPWVPPPRLR